MASASADPFADRRARIDRRCRLAAKVRAPSKPPLGAGRGHEVEINRRHRRKMMIISISPAS